MASCASICSEESKEPQNRNHRIKITDYKPVPVALRGSIPDKELEAQVHFVFGRAFFYKGSVIESV